MAKFMISHKYKNFLFIILLLISFKQVLTEERYVTAKPKRNDGIINLLNRYLLPSDSENIELFRQLNGKNISKRSSLLLKVNYKLPIKIVNYNGKNITSSTGIKNKEVVKDIELYNRRVFTVGLKQKTYIKGKEIWVPMCYLPKNKFVEPKDTVATINKKSITKTDSVIKENNIAEERNKPSIENKSYSEIIEKSKIKKENKTQSEGNIFPIFGKKYEKVVPTDTLLEGYVYYLDSGHGGPDPGAIGHKDGYDLWEDEYAFDVVHRLARELLLHSATVYLLVQEPGKGIRDDAYLSNDKNETYIGGITISDNLKERIRTRANIVNELFEKNKKTAKEQQTITIHLDSRTLSKKIDIFFYYKSGSKKGEKLANMLYKTIKNKYDENQPGRGYRGTITTRNLYMLNNTKTTSVYIELGNIQNKNNQIRFIEPDNRQAIAKWLSDGLLEDSEKE